VDPSAPTTIGPVGRRVRFIVGSFRSLRPYKAKVKRADVRGPVPLVPDSRDLDLLGVPGHEDDRGDSRGLEAA
jgi:hypothetical protein